MRIGAACVAVVAAISLYAQVLVSMGLMAGASPLAVIWRMTGYFTVLGNFATLILMAGVALTGKIRARTAGLITVVMAMVSLGYHGLLAGIWRPQGLAWWADQGLHTAVPVLLILWWIFYAPKRGLAGRDALRWMVWPMGYTAYAVARGLVSGFYPYPFVDISVLGPVHVALNIGALAVGFAVLSLLLIGIARLIR
jgi:hypothetical protein